MEEGGGVGEDESQKTKSVRIERGSLCFLPSILGEGRVEQRPLCIYTCSRFFFIFIATIGRGREGKERDRK